MTKLLRKNAFKRVWLRLTLAIKLIRRNNKANAKISTKRLLSKLKTKIGKAQNCFEITILKT
jgi:hypothetical protein